MIFSEKMEVSREVLIIAKDQILSMIHLKYMRSKLLTNQCKFRLPKQNHPYIMIWSI